MFVDRNAKLVMETRLIWGNIDNFDNQTLVKVECTTSDSMNVKFTEGLKAKF